MTKPKPLTPAQETAYHLNGIARGCLDDNTFALAEARRMLASKVLLAALEEIVRIHEGRWTSEGYTSATLDNAVEIALHAIAKATGDKP